jgi:NAD(P)-dependent dehydrogenase (short-subunit alcohol dehydrogenase family)
LAQIFITGSSDGLGLLTARTLLEQGHQVILHARNKARKEELQKRIGSGHTILTADLANEDQTRRMATELNQLGTCDAVIHNAGLYRAAAREIFQVNTLAAYLLTCLIHRPARLIYLSSDMHMGGKFNAGILTSHIDLISYSDSKLHVLMLAMAVARRWPSVLVNTVTPGWVPTKMGGPGAPDSLEQGYATQVWLSTSSAPEAMKSGNYFYHKRIAQINPIAADTSLQDQLLDICADYTGIKLPA